MGFKNLKNKIKRFVYPNSYSSDALICHIRAGGGIVGERCRFYDSASILVDDTSLQYIKIGNDVHITKDVIILAHDYSYSVLERMENPVSLRPQKFTVIGNNVFIGMRTIILAGANIGNNVIIGAGSVVTGIVESYSVYAGNPAKKICSLEEYKEKLRQSFPKSAANYILGFQRKNGRIPSKEEIVIYSTLIEGYENAYNGINKEVLMDVPKYKNVEDLLK